MIHNVRKETRDPAHFAVVHLVEQPKPSKKTYLFLLQNKLSNTKCPAKINLLKYTLKMRVLCNTNESTGYTALLQKNHQISYHKFRDFVKKKF